MKNILVIMVACVPFCAFAAEEGNPDCNGAGSTMEMVQCAGENFEKADAQLNKVYAQLIAEAKHADNDNGKSFVDDALGGWESSLRESQRAWVAFRDKDCLRQTTDSVGGSLRRVEYVDCRTTMTEARIKELTGNTK